ncbi:hypothetical protein R3W88_027688 [Solanum pinnatisectum]|uniref:Uncharacterized protein n=1 Tax=Solanum pinnatisectum TaxID=50273 RepID=A0AAV9LJL1_9SOLN|nr:hypothetical protein R3W88_027688 [Solanum pinnatisectum]
MLSSDEVKEMEKKPGFLSARPQRIFQLHTTHTPSFLGLHQNVGLWNASNSGKGVIIGILDTGIDPQHPSFNDNGMPNPPLKWKGKCEFNVTNCNKKLIGARNFVQPNTFPTDEIGHGTLTSSIAAGNFVDGANYYAGFDTAIEDGVDVIVIPMGLGHPPFYDDAIAISTYSAMEKGIFVNRKIIAVAVLGNGVVYEGESAFQPTNFSQKLLPLVNGKACESLNTSNVKGRVKNAGGAGMILMNEKYRGSTTFSQYDVVPTTQVSYNDGQEIINYMKSTSTPVGTISFRGTTFGDKHAPTGILKPDIIDPGLNILAVWPTPKEGQMFYLLHGTSNSCPHLAGVATLLKNAHPNWFPAAIKSAIMTTTNIVNLGNDPIQDETLEPADLLIIGSGHMNPSRAIDPGLVYDIQPEDYIPYLCGLNYTDDQISIIVKKLNCPSFSIPKESSAHTYTRTVTNVGEAISAYTIKVFGLKDVEVTVNPKILKFTALNQKASYNVTVKSLDLTGHSQGYIIWSSDRDSVRSPIKVFPHTSVI